jgi:tetratricopeptide (TPR) repeat protein
MAVSNTNPRKAGPRQPQPKPAQERRQSPKSPQKKAAQAKARLFAGVKDWGLVCSYIYLDQGAADRALNILEAFDHLFPNDESIIKMLAQAYLKSEDYQQAVMTCERYIEIKRKKIGPEDAPIYLMMADGFIGLKKPTMAKKVYDQFTRLLNQKTK